MKLTDFQLNRITTMAVDAYDCAQKAKESDAALFLEEKFCYAIFQCLNCLADDELSISEGRDVVFSNEAGKMPPTEESIKMFVASL